MGHFNKGELVWEIGECNSRNINFVRRAMVHSCGAKRMILMSPDGTVCYGRDYKAGEQQAPGLGQPDGTVRWVGRVVRGTQQQARALALQLAAERLAWSIANTERAIARNQGSVGYIKAMQEQLATLRTLQPECVDR